MTNQEILTKAIKKAIAGGWNQAEILSNGWGTFNDGDRGAYIDEVGDIWQYDDDGDDWEALPIEVIIFNHDFAKSLFGTELHNGLPEWRNALQYMVVQDDPIEALGRLMDK